MSWACCSGSAGASGLGRLVACEILDLSIVEVAWFFAFDLDARALGCGAEDEGAGLLEVDPLSGFWASAGECDQDAHDG